MKKILISLLFVSVSLWSDCIGDCANGYGSDTFQRSPWYGLKYEGYWKYGLPNGKGTIYKNGDILIQGYFRDGVFVKKDGKGTFTYPDGSKYIGEWKNDKLIKSKSKYIPAKKLKGYLEDDLIISMPDYDDILEKGEYVEINIDLKKIIIPKGYEAITLEEIPTLSVPADKRKINIKPKIVKTINQDKKVIKFEISTNIKLKSIKCNNKKLPITNDDDYIYKTKPRAIKNSYELKLISDKNEELIYDCDFNGCQKRKKGKL
jgi:hypothetical protein